VYLGLTKVASGLGRKEKKTRPNVKNTVWKKQEWKKSPNVTKRITMIRGGGWAKVKLKETIYKRFG